MVSASRICRRVIFIDVGDYKEFNGNQSKCNKFTEHNSQEFNLTPVNILSKRTLDKNFIKFYSFCILKNFCTILLSVLSCLVAHSVPSVFKFSTISSTVLPSNNRLISSMWGSRTKSVSGMSVLLRNEIHATFTGKFGQTYM